METSNLRRRALFGKEGAASSGAVSLSSSNASSSSSSRAVTSSSSAFGALLKQRRQRSAGLRLCVSLGAAVFCCSAPQGGVEFGLVEALLRILFAALLSLAPLVPTAHFLSHNATPLRASLSSAALLILSAPVLKLVREFVLRVDDKAPWSYTLPALLILGPTFIAIDHCFDRRQLHFPPINRTYTQTLVSLIPTIFGRSLRFSILYSGVYHSWATLLRLFVATASPLPNATAFLHLVMTVAFVTLLWETMYASIAISLTEPIVFPVGMNRVEAVLAVLEDDTTSRFDVEVAFRELVCVAGDVDPRGRKSVFSDAGGDGGEGVGGSVMRNPFNSIDASIRMAQEFYGGVDGNGGGNGGVWVRVAAVCLKRVEEVREKLEVVQREVEEVGGAGVRKVGGKVGGGGVGGQQLSLLQQQQNNGRVTSPSPLKRNKILTGAVKPSPGKQGPVDSLLQAMQVPDGGVGGGKNVGGGAGGVYKVHAAVEGKNEFGWSGMWEQVVAFVGMGKGGQVVAKKNKKKVESMEKVVERVFGEYQVLAFAIECVAKLLIAGTKEDPYGTVQRDIPVVVETLVRTLMAVETFVARPPVETMTSAGTVVLREPGAVICVLQRNVYFITTGLEGHLARYKFDARVAGKVKRFLEFME
ncbi:hypothetical protein HDU98_009939 [Podochytrium sp. JEL0797]|nr:hypothetical protein HDU98_009939 [Podochytrium sp. JEL0797]